MPVHNICAVLAVHLVQEAKGALERVQIVRIELRIRAVGGKNVGFSLLVPIHEGHALAARPARICDRLAGDFALQIRITRLAVLQHADIARRVIALPVQRAQFAEVLKLHGHNQPALPVHQATLAVSVPYRSIIAAELINIVIDRFRDDIALPVKQTVSAARIAPECKDVAANRGNVGIGRRQDDVARRIRKPVFAAFVGDEHIAADIRIVGAEGNLAQRVEVRVVGGDDARRAVADIDDVAGDARRIVRIARERRHAGVLRQAVHIRPLDEVAGELLADLGVEALAGVVRAERLLDEKAVPLVVVVRRLVALRERDANAPVLIEQHQRVVFAGDEGRAVQRHHAPALVLPVAFHGSHMTKHAAEHAVFRRGQRPAVHGHQPQAVAASNAQQIRRAGHPPRAHKRAADALQRDLRQRAARQAQGKRERQQDGQCFPHTCFLPVLEISSSIPKLQKGVNTHGARPHNSHFLCGIEAFFPGRCHASGEGLRKSRPSQTVSH